MEFIGSMQAIFDAHFPQVIVICRVLCFFIHHDLYGTLDIVAVFSSFVFYKSLDWHNLKDDSGYLRFAEGFAK